MAPAGLRSAVTFFGCLLVARSSGGTILGDTQATFLNHAVQVQRGRQAFLGGLAQMLEHLQLGFRVAGVARQDKRVPKLALRTPASGGFLVPAVTFRDVAEVFRSRRQDETQDRLALGRSGFGRSR